MSWNNLDTISQSIDKQIENKRQKDFRLKQLYHKVFKNNEDGKELLQLWKEMYIFNPIGHMQSSHSELQHNLGKQSVIFEIITLLEMNTNE